MQRIWFNSYMLAFLLMGIGFGYHLAPLSKLETFKLLNTVGLTYDLFGVLILSQVVATSERIRSFVVDRLPNILISAHLSVPVGIAGFSLWAYTRDQAAYPSAVTLVVFAGAFICAALHPIFFVEDAVLYPKIRRWREPVARSRILGAFFIILGILVQFAASIQDLFS